jgi:hypothetical protein
MKTYIQRCKEGTIEVNENSFDDFVDYWHTSDETRNISLHDAIGISVEEYGKHILNVTSMLNMLEEKVKS